MIRLVSLAVCFALAACGGGGDDPPAVDAPDNGIDAPPATVQTVEPCTGEVATIESTGGFRFLHVETGQTPPNVTIMVGQVVKFINSASHNVIPVSSDPGLVVGFGQTKCLRFTQAGTFNFRCQPHPSMTGTITVQ